MKQTVSQGGSTRAARPRPRREDFILRWISSRGSYRGDGFNTPDRRIAEKLAARFADLELVADESLVNGSALPGWRLQRRAR